MNKFKIGDWVQPTLETLEYAEHDPDADYPDEIHNYPFQVVGVATNVEEDHVGNFGVDYIYKLEGLSIGLYEFELETAQ